MATWLQTALRLGFRLGIGLVVILVLALTAATQTSFGKERVLREVLARVGGGIRGEILVEGISSPGLLNGFTFRGVTIRGEDGRPFLLADSVRAGLSAPALLRGDVVLNGVQLWRPRIRLEQLPGQDQINAVAIFVGPPPVSTDTSSASLPSVSDSLPALSDTLPEGEEGRAQDNRRTILLRNASLHEASLDILLPLPSDYDPEAAGFLTEPGPHGRPALRRLSFRDVELDLEQAILRAPDQMGERFEIAALSLTGQVWPEPFRVEGLRGEVWREGSRLVASLGEVSLPGSRARGSVDVDWDRPGGVRVLVEGEADPLSLEDLFFIEDRLPHGLARGPFGLELDNAGLTLNFSGTDLDSELGRIRAVGGLFLGRGLGFRDLDLDLEGVDLAVTDPWLTDTLPLRGWMTGDLRLAGSLEELEVEAFVDLTDPDSSGIMGTAVTGSMGVAEGFSASSLEVTLAPLEWGTLSRVSPELKLRGPGAVRLFLSGSLWGEGLEIDGELTHFPSVNGGGGSSEQEGLGTVAGVSRVTVDGWVRRDSSSVYLDLRGDLSPLSLTSMRRSYPALPLEGEYDGRVEVRGPLSELRIESDLETSGGPLRLSARLDGSRPSRDYALELEAREPLILSRLLPVLPEPTGLKGRVSAAGSGFSLDSLEGVMDLRLLEGEIGALAVDSADLRTRIQGGLLYLDEARILTEAGRFTGRGSFGVASWAPSGELALEMESESLEPLRPFLMPEPEFILDELSPFQLNLMVAEGVDPDSLPTAAEVALEGSVRGEAILQGGWSGFQAEGNLVFQNLRLRTDYVSSGELTFAATDLPGAQRRVQASIRTDSIDIRSLGFGSATGELDLGARDGRAAITARVGEEGGYNLRGTYALDSLGGIVNLDQLTVQFDSTRWNLGGPASFAWSHEGYRIRDFQLIRPGIESMRIRADGFLPLEGGGETDFEIEIQRLDLARLARATQMETPIEGVLDLRARMTGSPGHPEMAGSFRGRDLLFSDFSMGQLESEFRYEAESLAMDLRAWEGGRGVLAVEGHIPFDLRLQAGNGRIPDGPVDLAISVDSFPAAIALAFLEAMEEVEGHLTGDLAFGGRSSDLEPRGEIALSGGSALIPALGVRHRDVEGTFLLSPDGVVAVDGSLRSDGQATVTGTVTLGEPLGDPALDLSVEAQNFLAVNRRDVQARLSGEVEITKRYRRPRVEGDLTVEQGVLMVEEVARSVEVVDLSDPAFFNVVDTALVTLRPVLQSSQNPFLQNLQLAVDLTMAQDSWLRGRELNVEMAGNLSVYWDRTGRNLAFLGVLDAVRGVYSVFGRQFQVEQGTVSFPGTPGVNPDLDIRARNRIRTSANIQLDIIATVEGSLLEPRVSLSSNAAFPIAESDLVSYLIFGRPSFATASAQSAYARGAAGVFAGAASSLAVGLFSSELGSILAQDVGLDYLAVTQGPGGSLGMQALQGTVATTQVEIGQYLTEDIFAALHWRPWTTSTGQRQLAALRIETRLSDHWTLEGYWEDRFYRNPFYQVGSLGLKLEQVFGFFLYREWGY